MNDSHTIRADLLTRIVMLARSQGKGVFIFWLCVITTAALLLLGLRAAAVFEPAELYTYDQLLKRSELGSLDQRLMIIEASEQDLRQLGYPFSDQALATAIGTAVNGGAIAVGVDLYRDMPVAPGTDALHKLLINHPNIYWVYKFGQSYQSDADPVISAPKVLDGTGRVGFADFAPDSDGRVRRLLMQMQDANGRAGISLSMRMALHALHNQRLGLGMDDRMRGVAKLGQSKIEPLESHDGAYAGVDSAGYQLMMNFHGANAEIPRVRLADIVNGKVPAERFAGKLVFLGITAVSLADFFYTPLSQSSAQPRTAGVAMHAYATDQFLCLAQGQCQAVRPFNAWVEALLIILSVTTGVLIALRCKTMRWKSTLTLAVLLLLAASAVLMFSRGIWLPLFPMLMGITLGAVIAVMIVSALEQAERKLLMDIFSLHVSKDIAEALWHQRHHFMQHGRAKTQHLVATVVFTDIEGFTGISQKLPPSVLFQWLGEYLSVMTSTVEAHQGVVNKFIGDSIMAVFGIPLPNSTRSGQAEDSIAALNCALDMVDKMHNLNRSFAERDLPQVHTRIGIHSGDLIAGSVGSGARQEYTVLGDSVNVASRLESVKIQFESAAASRAARILVSGETFLLTQAYFEFHRVDSIELKGRAQSTEVYELISRKVNHS